MSTDNQDSVSPEDAVLTADALKAMGHPLRWRILCALGDIRNLYHSGLAGIQRIVRHVWRIGFSLVWAALAFTDKIVKMMGANIKSMPQDQLLLIIAVPTLLIVATVLYWITRIVFFSGARFAESDGRPG